MKKMFNCAFSAVRSLVSTSGDRRGGGRAPGVRRLGVESLEVRELLSVSNLQSSPVAMARETPEFICTTAAPEENILVSCSALIDDQTDQFDDVSNASPWDAFESDSCETGLESLARIRATAPEYGPPTLEQHLAFALLDSDEEPLDDGGDGDACGDGCDTGCDAGCENKILFAKLGFYNNFAYACNDGTPSLYPTELVVLQNVNGAVTVPAYTDGSHDENHGLAIIIQNPGVYWNLSVSDGSCEFTWTKPSNISNSEAQRDFIFNFVIYKDADRDGYYDANKAIVNSVSLTVHIAYAELVVSIAGEEFKPTSDLNTTAIVGQKIEAKVACDPRIALAGGNSLTWSVLGHATQYIKDYSVSNESGAVAYQTDSDIHAPVLKYYGLHRDTSCISCSFAVQWIPKGSSTVHTDYVDRLVSLNIISPVASIMADVAGTTQIQSNENDDNEETETFVQSPRFTVTSSICPISRDGVGFDNGLVNYLQTLTDYSVARSSDASHSSSRYRERLLDKSFPYGNGDCQWPSGWNLSNQAVNIATTTSFSDELTNQIFGSWNDVEIDQHYYVSLIYKPSGTDSIWVPIKRVYIRWRARCVQNESSEQWELMSSESPQYEAEPLPLQTWTSNTGSNQNWK